VRTPALAQGGQVAIKPREVGTWHWDDALQLEIHSPFPLLSLHIERVDTIPVLYLMGDSTVTDQTTEPWIGWGQMLPRYFAPTLSIANHAESGESLRLFREGQRFEKVMDTLKPGDFVMIQFGHNDMKESGPGIGAMTSYADDLRYYIRHIRGAGAEPILVTSMKRRRFDEQGRQFPSLGEYPIAVRRVAAELAVPVIDLNWMSGVFYSALGPEGSKSAFVHYPAHTFPGQDRELRDDTHFNAYGGDELASYVAEAIRTTCPVLATHLRKDLPHYDPSAPRALASLRVPASPRASVQKPDGD
jgi:lysophospholipase L1-like esterase